MSLKKENIQAAVTLVIIIAIIAAATFFVFEKRKSTTLNESEAGRSLTTASGASYTDISGNPISLDDYLGQNLIIHSWASWCPQCVEQLKLFSEIVAAKPETKLIAINRAEDKVTAERFLNYYGLWSEVFLVLDSTDHFYKSIGGYAMPETVIFDKNGATIAHYRGVVTKENIEEQLNKLE